MAEISSDFEGLLREGFLASFSLAVQEAVGGDRWRVRYLDSEEQIDAEEAYVLTVSSHAFRVVMALRFHFDEAMREFVAAATAQQLGALSDDACYDYLAEVGNVFCGAFKRELQKAVAALGMSTPNLLNRESLHYVHELKLDRQGHAVAHLDGRGLLYASYFLSAYGALNYTRSFAGETATQHGELELF